jgi:hypothetical protein
MNKFYVEETYGLTLSVVYCYAYVDDTVMLV